MKTLKGNVKINGSGRQPVYEVIGRCKGFRPKGGWQVGGMKEGAG